MFQFVLEMAKDFVIAQIQTGYLAAENIQKPLQPISDSLIPLQLKPGFSHLQVVVSIIIGLGITHVLQGFGRLIQIRERVKLYWVHFLWVLIIFTHF